MCYLARAISVARASSVRLWYQRDRAWWRRRQSSQCAALPGGGGRLSRRPVSGTVSGIIPNSAGGGWSGSTGAGAWVPVRRRSRAAVTAQMARAAMTSTVCRAIAVYSRTWDWSSPKQSFPNSKSSAGPAQPGRADRPGGGRRQAVGQVAVVKGELAGSQVAADQQVVP